MKEGAYEKHPQGNRTVGRSGRMPEETCRPATETKMKTKLKLHLKE
jgi:hypothetical protein